jgi:hypothetical protein
MDDVEPQALAVELADEGPAALRAEIECEDFLGRRHGYACFRGRVGSEDFTHPTS